MEVHKTVRVTQAESTMYKRHVRVKLLDYEEVKLVRIGKAYTAIS